MFRQLCGQAGLAALFGVVIAVTFQLPDRVVAQNDQESHPQLLILAVGISDYKQPRLQQGAYYNAQDANRFLKTQLARCKSLFADPVKIDLTGGKATRAEILNAFDDLSEKARAAKNPVTMIYLSGHGKTTDSGRFYFLAADSVLDRLRATAISGTELLDAAQSIPGKVILFLEGSYSGDLLAITNEVRPTFQKDGTVRSRSSYNRLVVICSSRGTEVGKNSSREKSGMLTLAVVEGLTGRAVKDKAGAVRLLELCTYVSKRVQELSEDEQHPSFGDLKEFDDLPLTKP